MVHCKAQDLWKFKLCKGK